MYFSFWLEKTTHDQCRTWNVVLESLMEVATWGQMNAQKPVRRMDRFWTGYYAHAHFLSTQWIGLDM